MPGAGMRKFILVANGLLGVLWLILIVVSRMPGQEYATEGLHGIMIFIVLPSFALGLWGRWLPLGVGLTSISVFMFVIFLVFAVAY
jgi:hypothetical protein